MAWPWRVVASRLTGLGLGLTFGFFLVLAGLFTDGPDGLLHQERLLSFALVVAGFFVAGIATSLVAPVGHRRWAWPWPAAPALVFALVYAGAEPGILGLAVLYVALATGASWAGAQVPRGSRPPVQP